LGIIPAAYASSLDNVKTTGDFIIAGFAKGLYSDTTVPKFNVDIKSNNASFKYPIYLNQSKILLLTLKSKRNFK
jgi:hypothetical protein